MIKVGITGGIGSGKTTVCKLFEKMDIPVYYADIEAKRLMTSDKILKKKIKQLLGAEAYYRNGRLNRKHVASIVFTNKVMLESLNNLVHPAVAEDGIKWFNKQKTKYAIKEAALLVENASYKQLDFLIVVTAPVEMRIKRVVRRDKSDYNQVKLRMANQLPDIQKKKVADFIIDNSGDVSLISQVWKIHRKLMEIYN